MDQDPKEELPSGKSMKLKDAQLLTKYTTIKDGVMYYDPSKTGLTGVPVDSIPLGTWEHMLKLEESSSNNDETKSFINMMIVRAKKKT